MNNIHENFGKDVNQLPTCSPNIFKIEHDIGTLFGGLEEITKSYPEQKELSEILSMVENFDFYELEEMLARLDYIDEKVMEVKEKNPAPVISNKQAKEDIENLKEFDLDKITGWLEEFDSDLCNLELVLGDLAKKYPNNERLKHQQRIVGQAMSGASVWGELYSNNELKDLMNDLASSNA